MPDGFELAGRVMHKSYLILKARGWASGEPSAINVACSVREGGNGCACTLLWSCS
jgi:hypothetical protein